MHVDPATTAVDSMYRCALVPVRLRYEYLSRYEDSSGYSAPESALDGWLAAGAGLPGLAAGVASYY